MVFPVRKRHQIGHLAFLLYGYEPEGREFESPRAHHSLNLNDLISVNFTLTVWRGNQKVGSSSPLARRSSLKFSIT